MSAGSMPAGFNAKPLSVGPATECAANLGDLAALWRDLR